MNMLFAENDDSNVILVSTPAAKYSPCKHKDIL